MNNFKRRLLAGTAIGRLRFIRVQVSSTSYAPVFGWMPG